jgi:hypothetical protein
MPALLPIRPYLELIDEELLPVRKGLVRMGELQDAVSPLRASVEDRLTSSVNSTGQKPLSFSFRFSHGMIVTRELGEPSPPGKDWPVTTLPW